MFDALLQQLGGLLIHQQHGLWAALLVFARLLAFLAFGTVFNRKDLPLILKISSALWISFFMVRLVPPGDWTAVQTTVTAAPGIFVVQVVVNIIIGAVMGFASDLVMQAIYAAGSMMTNQIGLSSAMMMDPTTRQQSMILQTLFSFIALVVFLEMDGLHWIIRGFVESLKVFPLQGVRPDLFAHIQLDGLLELSANTLTMAVMFIAPIMVVTIAVDVMLGVVNRAAQQIPVYQLSAGIKPTIGVGMFFLTISTFIQVVMWYLQQHHSSYF